MEGQQIDISHINVILATDCGSTTSKARLFQKINGEFRFVASGETPTTVEAPYEDVTLGVRNAIREIEEQVNRIILSEDGIIIPAKSEKEGVDLFVTTSSAGGGLQMMVAGVVKSMTAESAERAALGAGAIVMDVIAIDDGRMAYEKIDRMRQLRPDMLLLAGGTDGGTISHVMEIAELIKSANPKARLGSDYEVPIIYSGNKDAKDYMKKLYKEDFALKIVPNLRPSLEVEQIEPARAAVHEFFMEHVMSHAPGYNKLMEWTKIPIMPTPAGEGIMCQTIAKVYGANVIGVGLGGATTNVYSIYEEKFVRTVSANLGMSYSITNVMKEAGMKNLMRWLPFKTDIDKVYDKLLNKTIRPTTIPQTLEDLMIEHAVAREALRLGFEHHKTLARPLHGRKEERDLSMIFDQLDRASYIDMMNIDWLVGTGGLLSHAPRRSQSALILIDAFQPIGITKIGQDSIFMMPHLGVLSTVHPNAAMEIFEKDCLVRIGTCISPRGEYKENDREIMLYNFEMPDGNTVEGSIKLGEIKRIALPEYEKVETELQPMKGFDVGAGAGKKLSIVVEGGSVGIILDARGRPLSLSEDEKERSKILSKWFSDLNAYPIERIKG